MKKLTILSLVTLLWVSVFVACNSSENYSQGEYTTSNVLVTRFSLSKDDSVLANLDTVFFSIDLAKREIYNADSLPMGTRINKLVPKITVASAVSKCQLTVKRANGTDTVYDFLADPADSVDFSNGPVDLYVLSADGLVSMTYKVSVNVHQVKSDSLVWSLAEYRTLPTNLTSVKYQRTVQMGSALYCLTSDGTDANMAVSEEPAADDWVINAVTLPAGADVNTFSATPEALYILADGKLMTSADGGASWTDTGRKWHAIYGNYTGSLLGSVEADGAWQVEQYPGDKTFVLPAAMPVSGTSQPVPFDFGMGISPQMLMVGGVCADGTLSADTWAFDGSTFAKVSNTPLSAGCTDMTIFPYFTFSTNDLFVTTKYAVIMAMGGMSADGINRTVYLSNDYGLTWFVAGQSVQLPEGMHARTKAQAFIYDTVFHARSGAWRALDLPFAVPSRATEPVTEWPCPYIYMFGGTAEDGTTYNTVWRGVINRLTFKPLQ